jgi:hypothetical protein
MGEKRMAPPTQAGNFADPMADARDFKHSLSATHWHCMAPMSFHQELLMHMIALCLVRMAMLDAS